MSKLNRREFLRRSALGIAGLSVGGWRSALALSAPAQQQRVIVIGAGLAGLVAAYELQRAGHMVTVLEGRDDPGGRARTIRAPFADGQFAEAGAARIPENHDLTLGYANFFRLPLDPFYPTTGLFVNGGGAGSLSGYNPISQAYFYKIRGGTDNLPRAFAAQLTGKVRFGSRVTRVEHSPDRVAVTSSTDGAAGPTVGDHIICTIPFPVLERVEFVPALSPQKVSAVRSLRYEPVTRVYLQQSRRHWEDSGCNGFGRSNWPEEIWQPTWDQPGTRGIIHSYVRGDRALELSALPEAGRVAMQVEHWESVFPGVGKYLDRQTTHAWQLDEWTGGAYTQQGQGDYYVSSAEGRIHFAGEHASSYPGWMQGALQSGLRAAAEVDRRVPLPG